MFVCYIFQQETRKSQGSSVSGKRSPRGQKRYSLLSSLPLSKCQGEVTSELGGLKLNLKYKKANLQSGPSQGSKKLKKAKSQHNHVRPQHQLIPQVLSTPMSEIDICSSMPLVDPSSSTISPSSTGTIAEPDASMRDVPGLSIEEEGLGNANHQLSKHQSDVTEVDGTPMGYEAHDHLHLQEWMNYNLDYALTTKVKKKRTKLVAKSRKLQKNFSNDVRNFFLIELIKYMHKSVYRNMFVFFSLSLLLGCATANTRWGQQNVKRRTDECIIQPLVCACEK